ncbi:MAG: cadherin-like beta sandwich domain-containing protein [Peptococcaceae bacterium]|nr:cadherin-like beta sandwich domain-containing protein [Peptococcaceae bacterium]
MKRHNLLLRGLALLLSFIMVVGFTPLTAMAAGHPEGRFIVTPAQDAVPADAIHIATEAQLAAIGGPDSAGKYYVLDNDIDLTAEWTPIEDFAGTFDGQGHSINNLYVLKSSERKYAGLFGKTNMDAYNIDFIDVTIKNVGVKIGAQGVNAYSWAGAYSSVAECYAGGLIGCGGGTITNCYTTGDVTADSTADTDADYYKSASIANAYAGGLVGYGGGIITNCYSTGNVTTATYADADYTGSNRDYAGGLIGSGRRTAIANCFSTGNVTASVENYCRESDIHAGGLIGHSFGYSYYSYCTITNSYATGDVTASVYAKSAGNDDHGYYGSTYNLVYAGGMMGYGDTPLINCYATGDVTASAEALSMPDPQMATAYIYAGGLVASGYMFESAVPIANCYATGDVTTSAKAYNIRNHAGGLTPFIAPITNCYRLSTQTIEGDTAQGGSGTPLTPEAMKQKESFVGWDFDYTWRFIPNSNDGFPSLLSRVYFPTDRWSFENPDTEIAKLVYYDLFGQSQGNVMYKKYKRTNDSKPGEFGQCFGMAATTGAINNGAPKAESFGKDYLMDIGLTDRDIVTGLTAADFIKYSQVMQNHPSLISEIVRTMDKPQLLYQAEKAFGGYGGAPIVIKIISGSGAHAVYPLRIENETETSCEIIINDSNDPNNERVITLLRPDKSSDYDAWSYQMSDGAWCGTVYGDDSIAYCSPGMLLLSFLVDYAQYPDKKTVRKNGGLLNMNNAQQTLIATDARQFTASVDGAATAVNGDQCDTELLLPIIDAGGGEAVDALYWVNTDKGQVSSISFSDLDEDAGFTVAGQNRSMEVEVPQGSEISFDFVAMEPNITGLSVPIGEPFSIASAYESDTEEQNSILITGTSAGKVVLAKTENGVILSGAHDVTVEACVEDTTGTESFGDIFADDAVAITVEIKDGRLVITAGAGTMLSDAESVDADKAALTWETIRGSNTDPDKVINNLAALPDMGANGTAITWESDNPGVSNTGEVTRLAYGAGNATGMLTATISKGNESDTVEFDLTVLESPLSAEATLTILTVSEGALIPSFDANTTSYAVTVPNSVSNITIDAASNDTVSGAGTKTLTVGVNIFEIVVTTGSGAMKIYTVSVTREAATQPASDAEFLQEKTAEILANGLSTGNLRLEGKTLTLIIDEREFVLSTNANNRNISGEIALGDGRYLKFDIKGNGSNIKEFYVYEGT